MEELQQHSLSLVLCAYFPLAEMLWVFIQI